MGLMAARTGFGHIDADDRAVVFHTYDVVEMKDVNGK